MLATSLLLCSLKGSTSNEGLSLIVKKTFSSSATGCEKLRCGAWWWRQYVWIYGRRRYLLNPSISTTLLSDWKWKKWQTLWRTMLHIRSKDFNCCQCRFVQAGPEYDDVLCVTVCWLGSIFFFHWQPWIDIVMSEEAKLYNRHLMRNGSWLLHLLRIK